jgi:hypothetical protein
MTAVMRFMASRRRTSLLNILCHVTICVCVCVCVGGVGWGGGDRILVLIKVWPGAVYVLGSLCHITILVLAHHAHPFAN